MPVEDKNDVTKAKAGGAEGRHRLALSLPSSYHHLTVLKRARSLYSSACTWTPECWAACCMPSGGYYSYTVLHVQSTVTDFNCTGMFLLPRYTWYTHTHNTRADARFFGDAISHRARAIRLPHLLLAAAPLVLRRPLVSFPFMPVRRSCRLTAAEGSAAVDLAGKEPLQPPSPKKRASSATGTEAGLQKKKKEKGSAAKPSHASRDEEETAWSKGVNLVIGCDEAGRGPLAGPVVAAACALPASLDPIPGVGDSKQILDEDERERLYEEIVSAPGVIWSARIIPAARIDEINILMASLEAMRLCVVDVLEQAQTAEASPPNNRALVCVDGPFSPWKEGPKYVDFQTPALPTSADVTIEPIKGGDAKVYCIAAASILAKVTRDRAMRLYDAEWPAYDLKTHKGYPTPSHVAAISKHGACAIHRRTFAPLKNKDLPPPSSAELDQVEEIIKDIPTSGRSGIKSGKK